MSEPTHDPELTALERALAGLAPSAGQFNRDALMFAAGQRSVRRGWGWPSVAAGSALAAAVLGAVVLLRPPPEPRERVVVKVVEPPPREVTKTPDPVAAPAEESPPVSPPNSPRPEADYLTLRRQAERWGDAGLPTAPVAAEPERAAPDPLRGLPPDIRDDPWLQRRTALLNPGGSL
jgi:hypothetical protein